MMLNNVKMSLVVLLVMSLSVAMDCNKDMFNVMKQEMSEMKEHLALNTEQLLRTKKDLETKDDIIEELQTELHRTKIMLDDIIQTVEDDEHTTSYSIKELKRKIAVLEDP